MQRRQCWHFQVGFASFGRASHVFQVIARKARVGKQVKFKIFAKDKQNHRVAHGGDDFAIRVIGPRGIENSYNGPFLKDNADGLSPPFLL